MRNSVGLAFYLSALAAPAGASAELLVRFFDDTPHDRIEIVNHGGCDTGPIDVAIRLSRAEGDLFFDATGAGLGAKDHHPIRFLDGGDAVSLSSPVRDGDRSLALSLIGLSPQQRVVIAADIDHGLTATAEPYVGSGISGARVFLISVARAFEARAILDRSGEASLPAPTCAD